MIFNFGPPKTPKKHWARARFSARGRESAFLPPNGQITAKILARGAFGKKINIFSKIMKKAISRRWGVLESAEFHVFAKTQKIP